MTSAATIGPYVGTTLTSEKQVNVMPYYKEHYSLPRDGMLSTKHCSAAPRPRRRPVTLAHYLNHPRAAAVFPTALACHVVTI